MGKHLNQSGRHDRQSRAAASAEQPAEPRKGARHGRRPWLFIGLLASTLGWVFPAAAADSSLELALRLEKGHFAADRAQSRLDLTAAFEAASALDAEEVARQLFDDIDRYLAGQPAPYLEALGADERAAVPECQHAASDDAVDITAVCALSTASFAEAQRTFDAWAEDAEPGHTRFKLVPVLFEQMGTIADGLSRATALFRDDVPYFTIGQGRVRFQVAPPIAAGQDAFALGYRNGATASTAVLPPAAVRRILRPLEGRLWRAAEIRQRLQQVYGQRLGLASAIRVSRADLPRRIDILESPRISRIVLPKASATGGDEGQNGQDGATSTSGSTSVSGPASVSGSISKILYYLLEDHWYRQLMADGDVLNELTSIDGGFWALDLGAVFGLAPHELPYLDTHQLQSQLLAMAAIGYSATSKPSQGSGENERYVDLAVLALDTSSTAGSANATTPDPDPGEVADASDSHVDRAGVDRALELARVGAKKNFIGAGVDWRPDQGARAFALYRRRPVAGDQGDLIVIGGGFGDALGSVSYNDNFLPVGRLRRPLSLSVEAGNDFVRNRRFGPAELDERRRGGEIHASLELYRQRRGDALSISAGFRDLEVEILDGERTTAQRDLSLLDFGLTWSRARRLRPQPFIFELDATLTYGLERGGEPSFERLEARLSYHRDLWARFAWDQRLHLGWASAETPVFELPSLGGAESLRGFRSDTVLGEELWSLQSELWTPITTWQAATRSRLLELLSQLRLAIFVDVGDASAAALGEDGLRAGAGLGLRYRQPPITLALDWGYGFESPLSSERESKIYLSFRRLLP